MLLGLLSRGIRFVETLKRAEDCGINTVQARGDYYRILYDAFKFAFENIKSIDAVVVGMYPKEINQIEFNVEYVTQILGEG